MTKRFKYYTPIILQKIGYIVFFILHHIFVRIEIRGQENLLGLKRPVILASNHTSELDVTTVPLILSFLSPLYPVYFVSDPVEKFKTFGWRNYIYGGIFFNMLGAYAIHSGFKDYSVSLEDHLDLLEHGHTMFIFPEGKRSIDGKMSPAHGGIGFMVYETDATVVPIAINTFFNISWKKYFGFQRKVVVDILPPLSQNELIFSQKPMVEDFKHAGQIVLDKIKTTL